MKHRNSLFLFLLLFICSHNLSAQVSSVDRKQFAQSLNQRRAVYNLGVNPYAQDHISVTEDGITYNGVKSVSNIILLNAYPDEKIVLALKLFETMEFDAIVLDKFLYQLCLINEGNKNLITQSLNAFCGNRQLAERVYMSYWKQSGKKVQNELVRRKEMNKRRSQANENMASGKNSNLFDSPASAPLIEKPKERSEELVELLPPVFRDSSFGKFVAGNLIYPDSAKQRGIAGRVTVEFTIDTLGNVIKATVVNRKLGFGLEEEAVRIIMMSKWIPAKRRDNKTAVNYIQQVNINFNSEDE